MKKLIFGRRYAPPASNDLLNGLLAFYKLDGNPNDAKGTNHLQNGTMPVYENGVLDQCSVFNKQRSSSLNGMVPASFSPSGTGFSVSLWLNKNTNGAQDWLITKARGDASLGSQLRDFEICLYSGIIYFDVYYPGTGSYEGVYISESLIPNSQWNQLVFTYDGSGYGFGGHIKAYANGMLAPSTYEGSVSGIQHQPVAGTLTLGAQTFAIGNEQFNYSGKLDEVGLWNRPLSNLEVERLYNLETYPFN